MRIYVLLVASLAFTMNAYAGSSNPAATGNGVSVSGATTATHCAQFDANSNLTDSGAACGGGGVTFPLQAPNGSTAAPSYTFSSDTSAGFRYGTVSGNPYIFGTGGSTDVIRFSGVANRFEITSGNTFYMGGMPVYADPTISTPTTGANVDVVSTAVHNTRVINPSGTLATLTVTLEDGVMPGQFMNVSFTQAITALTMAGNLSSSGITSPTSAVAGTALRYQWSNSTQKWVRIQ